MGCQLRAEEPQGRNPARRNLISYAWACQSAGGGIRRICAMEETDKLAQDLATDDWQEDAWEQALEEAIAMFEQGEAVNEARFEELVAQLEARHAELVAMPYDDPRTQKLRDLRQRAASLEASAAEGHGPTDQLSSMLAPLTGSADPVKD